MRGRRIRDHPHRHRQQRTETSTSVNLPVAADTLPPADPASLTATSRGFTQIDLDWPASTDNVGVTGYHVERCQGSGCTDFAEIAAPTATHYSDTGLSPSTTYRYRVRAEDPSDNLGGYSPVAVATTDAAPPPPPGLVGAWAFNEGSGTTAADASGNGNVGTITGAQWTTQGRFGDALSFDGNSTVRVANAPSLNFTSAMTLSAWVRPTAYQSGWRTILQRLGGAGADTLNTGGDGLKDSSSCGTQADIANADKLDAVAADCETVKRS
jgi:chitodextrinase